jgi:hypothetical protein
LKTTILSCIPSIVLALVAGSSACASERSNSAWKLEAAAEAGAGFEAARYSDGWESGALLTGKGEAALHFEPSRVLRFLSGAFFTAESGPSRKALRAGGRFLSTLSPARGWKIRADLSGAFAEGEDPFRDFRRARATGAVELAIAPALLLVSCGYAAEANDFFRMGIYDFSHRAHAEAIWIPSVFPLALLQGGVFAETLRSTLEEDRRTSPGGSLAAELEILDGPAFSLSGEYRYDLFESGDRAHAVLLTARMSVKIADEAAFFVEYGLDLNGSRNETDAFLSQRITAGFRLAL